MIDLTELYAESKIWFNSSFFENPNLAQTGYSNFPKILWRWKIPESYLPLIQIGFLITLDAIIQFLIRDIQFSMVHLHRGQGGKGALLDIFCIHP